MCAAAAAGAVTAAAAQPALSPCWLKGVAYEARCGQLQRPLDPARPDGPTIEVHFAVLAAPTRSKLADPVFFFAGGPGQSAIDLAGPVSQQLARVGRRRDLVLIDQRGTGRSAPLRCDEPLPLQPLAQQADPREQLRRVLDCRDRLVRLPHGDLRFYTTAIATGDVEAVRLALQAGRINLVGGSYGTRAILDYLRQHPQAVRRAVLDGVAPPDMVLPQSSPQDTQRAMEALLASCEGDPACRGRHPTLRAQWRELSAMPPRDVSARHPVSGRDESFRLDGAGIMQLARAALYLPVFASGLPFAIDEAAAGRFTPLVGLAAAVQAGDFYQGMHFSVLCAEDFPRLPAAPAGGEDAMAALYRTVCSQWPRGSVPEDFYRMPTAAAPVLLLSGGLDPVTPPRHAQRAAQALGDRARHVSVAQAGHGVMSLPCLRDAVARFIDAADDAAALQVDASCAARVPRPPAYAAPHAGEGKRP